MAFREWCNEHRGITWSVLVLGLVLVIGSIVYQLLGNRRKIMTSLPDQYFSTDDGKTFFVAGGDNVAPFDYHGRIANAAYVYECGGSKFVGYLERFKPYAHKAMIENKATSGTSIYGREVKKPGATSWVSSGDFKASAMVADVHCPDGSSITPVPVEP